MDIMPNTEGQVSRIFGYDDMHRRTIATLQRGQALLAEIAQELTKILGFKEKIDSVLSLTGTTLDVSRVYIFEDDLNRKITNNTHEWCAEGVPPEIENLQDIPMDFVNDWYEIIGTNGYLSTSNIMTLPQNLREVLEPQGIISIVVFKLHLPEGGTGFVGFDECIREREWRKDELDILISITGIISSLYENEYLQRRLVANELNFRNMFDSITDFIFVSDDCGYLMHVNQAVRDKLIFEEIEKTGHRVHILDLHPHNFHMEAEQILQSMMDGRTTHCSLPLIGKNGKEIPVETTIWFGEWDRQEVLLGISKDITAEREATNMFNKLFEHNPLPIVVNNVESHAVTNINPAFEKILGYAKEELLGHRIEDLNLFPDMNQYSDIVNILNANKELEGYSLSLCTKSGDVLDGVASGSFITVEGSLQFMSVFTDLTQQVELRNRLSAKKRRLEHIVESTNLGTWEWNLQTNKTRFNYRWAEMIGYSLEELGDTDIHTWEKFLHPDDRKVVEKELDRHFKGETPFYAAECRVRHKEGTYLWIRDTGKIMEYSPAGEPLKMFGSHLDITLNKQAEQKLLEAKERAEKNNEAKSQFLTLVSHEIRTPIHTMQGITELLSKSNLTEKQQNYMLRLQQSSNLVLETVNNILDFSKIEAEKIELNCSPFFLNELMENLQKLFAFRFAQKGLDLVIYIHPDTPLHLFGDSFRLKQILQNLISNAEKFTSVGYVSLAVRTISTPFVDSASIEFSIIDTGVGIDDSFLPLLFEPYTQGHEAQNRTTFVGSGLGLPIVKQLSAMMGGTIRVSSRVGVGSTFTVEIPFETLSDFSIRNYVQDNFTKIPEMVFLQETLQTSFLKTGLQLLDFPVEKFEMSGVSNTTRIPDISVVILDWDTFTRKTLVDSMGFDRWMQDNNVSLCIVLVSVLTPEHEILRAFGFERLKIVKKPACLWSIMSCMHAFLNDAISGKSIPNRFITLRFGSILLCEDHAVNREIVQELLSSVGYTVDVVSEGLEAIHKLKKQNYDLLLLDIQMPGMDGFETAKIIREELRNPIPIIAFTAHALPEYEQRCRQVGMNGYLVKPIAPGQLYQTIDAWMKVGSSRSNDMQDVVPSQRLRSLAEILDPQIESEYGIKFTETMERYLYNIESYLKHINNFNQNIADFINTLENHGEEVTVLGESLHAIRGVAANLGMMDFAEVLFGFEDNLHARNRKDLLSIVTSLSSCCSGRRTTNLRFISFLEKEFREEYKEMPVELSEAPVVDLHILWADLHTALVIGDAEVSHKLAGTLNSTHFRNEVRELGKAMLPHIDAYDFPRALELLDSLQEEKKLN